MVDKSGRHRQDDFLNQTRFFRKYKHPSLDVIGDVKESRETKRKEFFLMKCLSYDRKDLNKHFKKMTKLFYILGADINLKQTFISSLPKSLADGAKMYIHNKYGSILASPFIDNDDLEYKSQFCAYHLGEFPIAKIQISNQILKTILL